MTSQGDRSTPCPLPVPSFVDLVAAAVAAAPADEAYFSRLEKITEVGRERPRASEAYSAMVTAGVLTKAMPKAAWKKQRREERTCKRSGYGARMKRKLRHEKERDAEPEPQQSEAKGAKVQADGSSDVHADAAASSSGQAGSSNHEWRDKSWIAAEGQSSWTEWEKHAALNDPEIWMSSGSGSAPATKFDETHQKLQIFHCQV